MDRRQFLEATLVASGAVLANSAVSYGRILGANERLRLGHIGIGSRGDDLVEISGKLKDSHKTEMVGVCDLWSVNRDKAVAAYTKLFGRAPEGFRNAEELLEQKDIDAVLISSPDHSHSPLLKMAVDAGKDVYVEKPMGNVLAEAKAARDAVVRNKRIVQVGTQHRSEPHPGAAHNLIQSGALGDVSKIEIVWNYHGPRWRGREEVNKIREQDTDWHRWLLTKPDRPFDPRLYFEFRLYREFSGGIPDQWMSHAIDLVHWNMDERFPKSVVSNGGVFAWHDGRENADTFQTLLEYPKGFLVSYSTSFGNDAPGFTRYMGKQATLVNIGGEGSPQYKLVEEVGNHEDNADIDRKRAEKNILLPGEKQVPPMGIDDMSTEHMANWLECVRSRQEPHSTVHDGLGQSVACIMATQSYWSGKRVFWNSAREEIVDQLPV